MLPENFTAVIARNETWSATAATEPHEAGWAREAIFFVRALAEPVGPQPDAEVEISPDGIRWVPEGTKVAFPRQRDEIVWARVAHFGGWLRLRARFADGSESKVLVTLHLKA